MVSVLRVPWVSIIVMASGFLHLYAIVDWLAGTNGLDIMRWCKTQIPVFSTVFKSCSVEWGLNTGMGDCHGFLVSSIVVTI